ncbi:hypothetical protein BDN67DRAFT_971323 [Paxillus ammoniavirescens]|nr:hypothetical protein BDN67DRAFT_971323 [Paxillus ammoniavirescens]
MSTVEAAPTGCLTDFAPYKPTHPPLDDPSDFSFFFNCSGRWTCYVAPERFYKVDEHLSNHTAGTEYVHGLRNMLLPL